MRPEPLSDWEVVSFVSFFNLCVVLAVAGLGQTVLVNGAGFSSQMGGDFHIWAVV